MMLNFNIDHLIVYIFLSITLAIGLLAGRKVTDIREYAVANRQFGTGVLTMTILATYITGSKGIGYVGYVFDDGILPVFSILICGAIITFLCIAWYIAPNIQYFKGCLTLPELMGQLYGQQVRLWMGILGTFYSVALVTLQIIWLGYVGILFDLPSQLSIFLGGFFLVIYAARGGMKAVAITDVLQFIAILVFVPLVAYVVLYHVGGIKALFSQIPSQTFDVLHHPSLKNYVVYCIWDLFPAFPLSFPFIQRMLMARDKRQIVDSYYIGLCFLVVFYVLLTLIGLAAIALRANVDAHIPQQGSSVFIYIVKNYLPLGARGIICAGFIAGVMSTADSFLHTAGLTLVHDVLQTKIKKKDALIFARYLTLLIGLVALVLALSYKSLPRDLYGGLDLGKGLNLITEVVALIFTIPLVAGIMGLKTEARSFWISAFITVIVFLLSRYYLSNEFVLPLAITTNVGSFFGTNYLCNKGFVVGRRALKQQIDYIWEPTRARKHNSLLTRVLHAPRSLLRYSQNRLEKYGANPTLFALFISLSYMIPFFMHSYAEPAIYNWLLGIRGIGVLLCVGLMLESYWPKQLLHYFPSYYHFSLLYCLPFVTTLIFLLEGGSVEWLLNVALSIMLLIVLVDWLSFIWLSIIGTVLALGVYRLGLGPLSISISLDIETKYTLVYAVLFSTLIGLLFARRKQKGFDALAIQKAGLASDHQEAQDELFEATQDKFQVVKSLQKAGIEELGNIAQLSKELLEISRQDGRNNQLASLAQQLNDKLTPMALQLDKFGHRATGFLLLENVEWVAIEKFLQMLQQEIYAKGHELKIVLRTQRKTIQCDVEKMMKVLINSYAFIQAVAGEEGAILLGIEDTQLGYSLDTKTTKYTKQVTAVRFTITTALELPKLEERYISQMDKEMRGKPEAATGLLLLTNERIVKAHYGYSNTISEGKDLNLVYVIPVDIREVRSKDMDVPQMKLGAEWPRADDSYPGAQEQERELLSVVKKKTGADLSLVEKAIDLIKDYHGPVMRKSGEPFYLHPIAVAQIVLDYDADEATILGALLHDTVEDTPLTLEQIELLFNKEVRHIVSGVTHMESNRETNYKVLLSHPENIHRLLEAEDRRVLYVKLADRMHNMRTIEAKSYTSQQRTAEETLLFFVPLAKYLGLMEAAEELKERSFGVLGKKLADS